MRKRTKPMNSKNGGSPRCILAFDLRKIRVMYEFEFNSFSIDEASQQ